ncbi:MAG TPA: thiamine pyrophosphate-dependent enzyme [Polyangia bacterium]|jgi:indolepyruvate ferredoxin oxidoreductase alpha subunit
MTRIDAAPAGATALLLGNEAIARGALEAGVRVAAAYPGNPSSEIIATLAEVDPARGLYVEWSVNEKVALETAAAASLCGVRALAAMKQNGLNVAADFLLNLNLTGTGAGLVLVVCDDPAGLSSTNEQDSRSFAHIGDLPLLEPGDVAEAGAMTAWAFTLSEELRLPVLVRSVTRISHASAAVTLGALPPPGPAPRFDRGRAWIGLPVERAHRDLHAKLARAGAAFAAAPFNRAAGPAAPDLTVIACGTGGRYAEEMIAALGAGDRVALVHVGTTWPLPEPFLLPHLARARRVLVLEEVDPVLEEAVQALGARRGLAPPAFCGRTTGALPAEGELGPDLVRAAIAACLGLPDAPRDPVYAAEAAAAAALAPPRPWGFCAGCPHRASYWAIKQALALDGRDGFVAGDIGCYSLGFGPSGFGQMRTMQAMGSGAGLASGLGALAGLGLAQPALAVCGDSTFFHAVLPALVNARYNGLDLRLVVLDNAATAMTGFQPHPGTGRAAQARPAHEVAIEAAAAGLGATVRVQDPFDLAATTRAVHDLLAARGVNVLVLRQPCALVRRRAAAAPAAPVRVDPARCRGAACGCNRLCTRVFRCPGLLWDAAAGVAAVDAALCSGCGVCTQICPAGALATESSTC